MFWNFQNCVCVCLVWLSCSVHLARRVLQLERQNTSLRRELERHKSQTGQISGEVNTHKHTHTHSVHVCACLGTIINGIKFNLTSKKKSFKTQSTASQYLQHTLVFPSSQISHSNSQIMVIPQFLCKP